MAGEGTFSTVEIPFVDSGVNVLDPSRMVLKGAAVNVVHTLHCLCTGGWRRSQSDARVCNGRVKSHEDKCPLMEFPPKQ